MYDATMMSMMMSFDGELDCYTYSLNRNKVDKNISLSRSMIISFWIDDEVSK